MPGIDDGAKNLDDSLRLIKALQGFGTKQFITTPHIIQYFYNNDFQSIKSNESVFNKNLEQNNSLIPFRAAAEYMMDECFVKLFKSGELLTLKDNYVLVEMSYLNPPIQLYSIIFELQVAGYIPILAHPERYTFYHKNLNEYKKLINAGCLFQLNLLSVVGYYGAGIATTADYLLKNGLYSFVGSDVHHDNHIAAFEKKIITKDAKALTEIISNNLFFEMI
jgi:tyrosine-protein phosphatase YwqE